MEENKICPIMSVAKHLSETIGTNNGLVLCEKSNCAWYEQTGGGWCAIRTLSALCRLDDIASK